MEKLTAIDWTEFFLLHEAHHIFTISQMANHVDFAVAGVQMCYFKDNSATNTE